MMRIHIIGVFPEILKKYFDTGLVKKAVDENLIEYYFWNLRDYGVGKHKIIDDMPYGGAGGMVLKPEPFFEICDKIFEKYGKPDKIILMSAQGKLFNQRKAFEYSKLKSLVILCGRYEGVDERVVQYLADEEVSIGNFIISSGEPAALVVLDSTIRLIPDVIKGIGKEDDTFFQALDKFGYPQWTRPEEYRNKKVPAVLLSGHHNKICKFREEQAKIKLKKNREDLIKNKEEI